MKIETDKHLYEGQVVLAPRGAQKTDFNIFTLDIKFKDKILDYSQQTRSYLMFSDWDNEYFEKFFFSEKIHYELSDRKLVEVSETVPRDPKFTYMPNSIMYLEQQISKATRLNNDDNYDSIIPYMVYGDGTFIPTLQFADSGGNRLIPEFYQEYPIFISPEIYDSSDLYKDYHSIYKVYDGTTNIIQLIPSDSTFTLHSDVMSFDAYFIDASRQVRETASSGEYTATTGIHTYEEPFGSYSDCYTFNSDTGTLELDSTMHTFFSEKIASYKLLYPDSEPSFVFEFHIEKYRSLEDVRDLSSKDVIRIATMQAAHETIFEYTYQHSIATSAQTKLSSAAYTAYITFISVMVSIIPITIGTTIAKIASSSASITSIVSASALRLATVVASEIGEELLLDPWIEATVSTAVGDAGGGFLAQAFATSFAESGRETFMGGVSHVYKSAISNMMHTKTQVQSEISAKTEIQEQIQLIKEAIKAEEKKKERKRILFQLAASTLTLFMDLVSGVPIGSIGYSVGTGVVIAYQGIMNARVLKSMVRQVHPHPGRIESDTPENSNKWYNTLFNTKTPKVHASFTALLGLITVIGSGISTLASMVKRVRRTNRPTLSLAAQMVVPLIDLIRTEKPGLSETEYAKELGIPYDTFLDWTGRIQAMTDHNRDIKSDIHIDNFRRMRLAIKRNFPIAHTSAQMAQLISTYTQVYYGNENFWIGIIDKFDKYSTDRIVPVSTLSTALGRFVKYVKHGLIWKADNLRSNKYPGRFFDILVRISLMEPSDLNLENPNDLVEIQKETRQYIFETVQYKFGVPDELQGRFDMLVDSLIAFSKSRRTTSGDNKYAMQLADLSEIVSPTGDRKLLANQLQGVRGKSRILWHYRQVERIVIALRKEFFSAKKESHKAIEQLKIYMRDIYPQTKRFRKYNINFKELKVPQMKEFIDITLGLDVYAKKFLEDAAIGKNRAIIPQIVMEMTRHHPLQDPDYYLIFGLYDNIFSFRLAPVTPANNKRIHKYLTSDFDQTSDLIVARLMHLYELIQKPFVSGTDYKTYKAFFEKEFREREAYIFGRGDTKIWNGINPDIVTKYAKRWVQYKDDGESVFYNDNYPTFYNQGYKWFMNDFKLYLNEDPGTSYPEFWYWHSTVYLPQSIYPFLDSLRWNQE